MLNVITLNVVRLSVVTPVLCLGIITKIIFSQAANFKHILQVLFILCRNKLVRLKSTEAMSTTKKGSRLTRHHQTRMKMFASAKRSSLLPLWHYNIFVCSGFSPGTPVSTELIVKTFIFDVGSFAVPTLSFLLSLPTISFCYPKYILLTCHRQR